MSPGRMYCSVKVRNNKAFRGLDKFLSRFLFQHLSLFFRTTPSTPWPDLTPNIPITSRRLRSDGLLGT